ncbi:hypothetical protein [Streptomyces erythrochromogenes]|uniref:hypothetical protein n=1 Tax=Streptomyces erythrochromogenes TaxID=285574 RepID=UPI00367D91B8
MLEEARALGLDRVLLVRAVDNLASAGTTERNGGVLEGAGTPDTAPRAGGTAPRHARS